MRSNRLRVVIVGAGIVGTSIAWHLARRGAAVTLVDKGAPGGGVTARAFGWINVAHGQPQPLREMRHLATHEWRRLQVGVGPRLAIDWCGGLTWTKDTADAERMARDHAANGYDVRLMERDELARREPYLIDPPACAAFAPGEGAIEGGAMTAVLAEAAVEAGAALCGDATATVVDTRAGRVTGLRTSGGAIDADVVVLAAGTGSRALAEGAGVPLGLEPSPAIRIDIRAPHRMVHTIMTCPVAEIRHGGPGGLVAAEDADPDPDGLARRTLAALRGFLRGGEELQLVCAEAGQRPMPTDDMPIIGFTRQIPGLYVAAMHAGVTLAPLVGRLVATEILDDVAVAMLDPYRPARFT